MSNLFKRFKEDLQLAGYANPIIGRRGFKLQRFYNNPLEDISETPLRQYGLCCQSELGWSAATLGIHYAGQFKADSMN